jgi:hypothetical protein
MRLEYEQSLQLLHISAEKLFLKPYGAAGFVERFHFSPDLATRKDENLPIELCTRFSIGAWTANFLISGTEKSWIVSCGVSPDWTSSTR